MTTGDFVFDFPVVHYLFKANATVPNWEESLMPLLFMVNEIANVNDKEPLISYSWHMFSLY
jgi:hypothetical protein